MNGRWISAALLVLFASATTARAASSPEIEALSQLVRQGKLRAVSEKDIETWVNAVKTALGPKEDVTVDHFMEVGGFNTLVVTQPFEFPSRIQVKILESLLIPAGTDRPQSIPTKLRVYDVNSGSCVGNCMRIRPVSGARTSGPSGSSNFDLVLMFSCDRPDFVDVLGGTDPAPPFQYVNSMMVGRCCRKLERNNRNRVVTLRLSYLDERRIEVSLDPDQRELTRKYTECVETDYSLGKVLDPGTSRQREQLLQRHRERRALDRTRR